MTERKTKRNDASIKGWLAAIADPERRKGKSCLYIKRMSDIDTGVLKELVTASVRHMRSNAKKGN